MSVPTPPQVNNLPRVGSTTIEVWWDPPVSDGGDPVLDYTLSCASPVLSFTIPAPQNYYLVTGLTVGVSYAFTSMANNTNGSSDSAAYRTVLCGIFPAAPENVSTVYKAISSGIATVTWDVPLSDGGATLKYYAVEASPQYPEYVSTVSFGTPATQLQRYCTGFTPNQNYKFAVNSINDPGYSLLPSTTNYLLFSPFNVSDLFLWFDGADPSSYTTDPAYGNAVTTWRSKTTNGFSTIGETVTRSPFLSNAEFGIFPGLSFFVPNSYAERTTMISPNIPALTCNNGFIACTVVRQLDSGTVRGIWSTYSEFPNGINLFFNTINQFEFYNNNAAVQITPSTINTNTLITCAYETTEIGGSLNFGITINGNDLLTTTTGSQPIVSGLVFGNFDPTYLGGFIYPDNGYISEHIVAQNDPSQTTRQKIEGYLAWKYNLASELPPTHPYYASPPLP